MRRISELEDDVELSYEDSHFVYTVGELKELAIDPLDDGELLTKDWFLIERKRWKPDARSMIDNYIENEYQSMYEDWDERAMDCVNEDVVSKLQMVLEEAFKGNSVSEYWDLVEAIDINFKR